MILGQFSFNSVMAITPTEARQIARDYVAKTKAAPPHARLSVSDFGKLVDGSYSVLVDLSQGAKGRTRYRVKMDKNGVITSIDTR